MTAMVGGCGLLNLVTLDMTGAVTEDIVKDYVATCMRRNGYDSEWSSRYPVPNPTRAIDTMRTLGEQFERAYFDNFDNMLDDFDITSPEAETNFNGVVRILFNNGIKWGRIIGLIVFSSKLSLKAIHPNVNRHDLVDRIVLWTCNVLQSRDVCDWMAANNNWVRVYDYKHHSNCTNVCLYQGARVSCSLPFGLWQDGFVKFYENPQNRRHIENGGLQLHWREIVTAGVATIAGAAAVFNFFQR